MHRPCLIRGGRPVLPERAGEGGRCRTCVADPFASNRYVPPPSLHMSVRPPRQPSLLQVLCEHAAPVALVRLCVHALPPRPTGSCSEADAPCLIVPEQAPPSERPSADPGTREKKNTEHRTDGRTDRQSGATRISFKQHATTNRHDEHDTTRTDTVKASEFLSLTAAAAAAADVPRYGLRVEASRVAHMPPGGQLALGFTSSDTSFRRRPQTPSAEPEQSRRRKDYLILIDQK